ncbi:polyadenylate-binding protein-interacting protein 2-like [Babylonia areolata]|uniref:polyadenylate-binding protein-interacting protein 2-like n=1 Tax=Babylonia areolata TaxID=304850 RepID=UPI003FD52E1E
MNMRTPPSLLDEEQVDSQPPENPGPEVDFSEYMWMGEELEEFDRQVEEELWEQAFIEACFEDMLAEEELHWYFSQLPHSSHLFTSGSALTTFSSDIPSPPVPHSSDCKKDDMLKSSNLNPEAPEFVPKASMKRVN